MLKVLTVWFGLDVLRGCEPLPLEHTLGVFHSIFLDRIFVAIIVDIFQNPHRGFDGL